MGINTEVYGSPEQWINASFQQAAITDKNKWAYFSPDFPSFGLATGVSAGKLSYSNGIDKSLSFCGLGTESALSHIAYITINNGIAAITDRQDRNVTNFGFFDQARNNTILGQSNFYTDQLSNFTWQSANPVTVNNYNGLLAANVLINPQNQIFVIRVNAFNAALTNNIDVSLKDYIANYKTTYPNIAQVYLETWTGNILETEQRDKLGGAGYNQYFIHYQLAILDEYEIESKNIKFNTYAIRSMPIFGNFVNAVDLNISATSFGMVAFTEKSFNHIKVVQNTGSPVAHRYYTEYYPEFEQDILKTAACFGLYFTPNANIAERGALTDPDMYIGILNNDGIGHGNYLRGADTVQAPQNTWADMSDSGYDYQKEVDKTKYKNDTEFYTTWASSAFTKMYVLRGSDVSSLANELYTIVSQAPQGEEIERYNQSVFLTQNPIDCIISLKKFPIEIFPNTWIPTTPIKLGSYTCQTTGSPLPYTTGVYNFTFSRSTDTGLVEWFGGSFLDYEPYTKAELSIPFCGTVEIPCCYMYKYDTITVKLVVDFITGACTAYILARDITIDSVSGDCAVNLPVNGIQSANLDSQIYSAAANRNKSAFSNGLGLIGGAVGVLIGVATGGAAAAVAGGIAAVASATNLVVQDKKIEYELQHMQLPLKQISAASGAISQSYDMRCKLRITRPIIDEEHYDPEIYAETTGFACLIQGIVSDFSGLTVGEIDLNGVAAPEAVKKMLRSLFAEGVYL